MRLISRLGIAFSAGTPEVLRVFREEILMQGGKTISYSATLVPDEIGTISIALGGDHEAQPLAIEDQLADIVFYWYAEPEALERVRLYCVDSGFGRATRLIPLAAND